MDKCNINTDELEIEYKKLLLEKEILTKSIELLIKSNDNIKKLIISAKKQNKETKNLLLKANLYSNVLVDKITATKEDIIELNFDNLAIKKDLDELNEKHTQNLNFLREQLRNAYVEEHIKSVLGKNYLPKQTLN